MIRADNGVFGSCHIVACVTSSIQWGPFCDLSAGAGERGLVQQVQEAGGHNTASRTGAYLSSR